MHADLADPLHRRCLAAAGGRTFIRGQSKAAPLAILVGHNITMRPPVGLPCLLVVTPSATASGSAAPSLQQSRHPLLPALTHCCPERACMAAEEVGCGVVRPPRCWGCQATVPPSTTSLRTRHRGAPPLPPPINATATLP